MQYPVYEKIEDADLIQGPSLLASANTTLFQRSSLGQRTLFSARLG